MPVADRRTIRNIPSLYEWLAQQLTPGQRAALFPDYFRTKPGTTSATATPTLSQQTQDKITKSGGADYLPSDTRKQRQKVGPPPKVPPESYDAAKEGEKQRQQQRKWKKSPERIVDEQIVTPKEAAPFVQPTKPRTTTIYKTTPPLEESGRRQSQKVGPPPRRPPVTEWVKGIKPPTSKPTERLTNEKGEDTTAIGKVWDWVKKEWTRPTQPPPATAQPAPKAPPPPPPAVAKPAPQTKKKTLPGTTLSAEEASKGWLELDIQRRKNASERVGPAPYHMGNVLPGAGDPLSEGPGKSKKVVPPYKKRDQPPSYVEGPQPDTGPHGNLAGAEQTPDAKKKELPPAVALPPESPQQRVTIGFKKIGGWYDTGLDKRVPDMMNDPEFKKNHPGITYKRNKDGSFTFTGPNLQGAMDDVRKKIQSGIDDNPMAKGYTPDHLVTFGKVTDIEKEPVEPPPPAQQQQPPPPQQQAPPQTAQPAQPPAQQPPTAEQAPPAQGQPRKGTMIPGPMWKEGPVISQEPSPQTAQPAPAAPSTTSQEVAPQQPQVDTNYSSILEQYMSKDKIKQGGISGLSPEMQKRLGAMLRDAPESVRKEIRINSGYRTRAKQAALYARSGGSGMVAKPGGSYHEKHNAVDIGSTTGGSAQESWYGLSEDTRQYLYDHMEEYGLYTPMWGKTKVTRKTSEEWHFEPIGTRKTGTGQVETWTDPKLAKPSQQTQQQPSTMPRGNFAGLEQAPGAQAQPLPAPTALPPEDTVEMTKQLLREYEASGNATLRAYRDKGDGKWRVGYGSDTTTDAQGNVRPVGPNTTTTREDAERDLARRIPEYQGRVQRRIGVDAWNNLPPREQAALTSVTYNYGHVPRSVARTIGRGGNVADSIASLTSNAERRRGEADFIRNGPSVQQQQPPAPSSIGQRGNLQTGAQVPPVRSPATPSATKVEQPTDRLTNAKGEDVSAVGKVWEKITGQDTATPKAEVPPPPPPPPPEEEVPPEPMSTGGAFKVGDEEGPSLITSLRGNKRPIIVGEKGGETVNVIPEDKRRGSQKVGPGAGPFMETARQYMPRFQKDLGLEKFQAAAMMGSFGAETGGFRHHQEILTEKRKQRGERGGIGWAQWTGKRRTAFEQFANERQLDPQSHEASYQQTMNELTNDPYWKKELDRLKQTKTLEEAATTFSGTAKSKQGYLRPGKEHNKKSIAFAQQAYNATDEAQSPTSVAMASQRMPTFTALTGMRTNIASPQYHPDRPRTDTPPTDPRKIVTTPSEHAQKWAHMTALSRPPSSHQAAMDRAAGRDWLGNLQNNWGRWYGYGKA